MTILQDGLTLLLAAIGLFFMLVASVGVLRMPDLFTRMHAATKASTMGISAMSLAALVYFASAQATPKLMLIILFFLLTAPVGAHALGRSAYLSGVELAAGTRRFDLEKARLLCATRGGPQSSLLHERAIELAQTSRGELTFLYVINRELFDRAASPDEAARVLAEMESLAQTVVAGAQAQARAQGVAARGEVRVGAVEAEIVRLTQEMGATVVLLGYTEAAHADEQHVAEEALWALVETIQEQTDARVVTVR
jgi:multicomponent Na+:H+ antiporter subunit G